MGLYRCTEQRWTKVTDESDSHSHCCRDSTRCLNPTMFIKFFCRFLDTSCTMPIRLGDSEDLTVHELAIAVYGEHRITFEEAKVGLRELRFFALVRPASI